MKRIERLESSVISAPVVIIGFNRPDLMSKLINRLSQFPLSRLYVILDGPRLGHQADVDAHAKILDLVDRIDFAADIRKNVSLTNLGCRDRIITGLDWVFSNESEAIILEDDCLPSATFLPYCQQMLAAYRYDERVGLISGTNMIEHINDQRRYFYSKYANIWGWASWQRVWANYDPSLSVVDDPTFQRNFMGRFDFKSEFKFWNAVFNQTKSGGINTWDYQLWLSIWKAGQVSIVPSVNQIDNAGFQHPLATHTGSPHPAPHLRARCLQFPLDGPVSLLPEVEFDQKTYDLLYQFPPLAERALNRIKRMLGNGAQK